MNPEQKATIKAALEKSSNKNDSLKIFTSFKLLSENEIPQEEQTLVNLEEVKEKLLSGLNGAYLEDLKLVEEESVQYIYFVEVLGTEEELKRELNTETLPEALESIEQEINEKLGMVGALYFDELERVDEEAPIEWGLFYTFTDADISELNTLGIQFEEGMDTELPELDLDMEGETAAKVEARDLLGEGMGLISPESEKTEGVTPQTIDQDDIDFFRGQDATTPVNDTEQMFTTPLDDIIASLNSAGEDKLAEKMYKIIHSKED